jgi:hypothetical protein
MKPKLITQYKCDSCSKLHSDYSDAGDCCAPDPETVYACSVCKEELESADFDRHDCLGEKAPEWIEGELCLCGAHLIASDYRPSTFLGAEIRCERCRDKVLAGIPAGEAVRQSFLERGLRARYDFRS